MVSSPLTMKDISDLRRIRRAAGRIPLRYEPDFGNATLGVRKQICGTVVRKNRRQTKAAMGLPRLTLLGRHRGASLKRNTSN